MAWGMVQLPGNEREYSVYATEAYYTGPDSRLRRFTYRVDGFVSLRADEKAGGLITRPITFTGDRLEVNFVTRGKGSVRVEIQDAGGRPLRGFTAADCVPLRGHSIRQTVAWKSGADVGKLSGTPVRVSFALESADLFSIRFYNNP
jgi:hypothetical protein